ncbi:hypothetical protein K438DRAFT_228747 [Mycena galopus ATCC 62051]|nr:hypothetical protein K438DRAFT_228747 [Mycena galopus ATCC 62051]
MTNAPPGSSSSLGNSNGSLKRPLSDGEGSTGSYKRQRERERDREPRDWRDVHLNRGGGGGGGSRRRGGEGRRDSHNRERERERDRDRERDRERDRDRNRGKDRDRDRDIDRRSDRSPRKRTPPPQLAEKEEGEISPRPRSASLATPPPVTPTPAPTPMEVEPERELDLAPSPPPVEQTLAERRARRAAILARHANSNPGSTGPLGGASPSVSTFGEANGNAPPTNGHGMFVFFVTSVQPFFSDYSLIIFLCPVFLCPFVVPFSFQTHLHLRTLHPCKAAFPLAVAHARTRARAVYSRQSRFSREGVDWTKTAA